MLTVYADTISEYENKHITGDTTLFTDYIESWLNPTKNQVTFITWQGYNSTVEKHIIPYQKLKLDLKELREAYQNIMTINSQGKVRRQGRFICKVCKATQPSY